MGNPKTQALHACFQGLVDSKNRPYEISDGKARARWETAKWVLLLSEFDIKYVTQKSVKGRAIADRLAHCLPEGFEEIQGDFLDEDIMGIKLESWKMYFNEATN